MERPCVLVIVTDQQRQRAWWPSQVQLPALDALTREGLAFTRAYTPSALCTPARAGLFTGYHASSVRMDDNVNFRWQASLNPDVRTLGTRLTECGYRASYLGKWHLARDKDLARGAPGLTRYGFQDWNGPDRHGRPHEGTKTDPEVAEIAVKWLAQYGQEATPWCLTVSFVNPHDIMFSPRVPRPTREPHAAPYPASFADDLAGKPAIHRRFRLLGHIVAGFVRHRKGRRWQEVLDAYIDYQVSVDRCIARVLDGLDTLGLARRTIVLYTSDHGELAGAHGMRGKGPVVYEENSRVPFIARCPGLIAPGTTDALYSSIDLTPTVLGLIGADAAPRAGLPGADQSGVVFGKAPRARDALLFHYRARCTLGVPWSRARGFVVGRFDGRYKFARYFSRLGRPFAPESIIEDELYDLANDPDELKNLVAPGPRRVSDVDSVNMEHAAATEALARAERAFETVLPA